MRKKSKDTRKKLAKQIRLCCARWERPMRIILFCIAVVIAAEATAIIDKTYIG